MPVEGDSRNRGHRVRWRHCPPRIPSVDVSLVGFVLDEEQRRAATVMATACSAMKPLPSPTVTCESCNDAENRHTSMKRIPFLPRSQLHKTQKAGIDDAHGKCIAPIAPAANSNRAYRKLHRGYPSSGEGPFVFTVPETFRAMRRTMRRRRKGGSRELTGTETLQRSKYIETIWKDARSRIAEACLPNRTVKLRDDFTIEKGCASIPAS